MQITQNDFRQRENVSDTEFDQVLSQNIPTQNIVGSLRVQTAPGRYRTYDDSILLSGTGDNAPQITVSPVGSNSSLSMLSPPHNQETKIIFKPGDHNTSMTFGRYNVPLPERAGSEVPFITFSPASEGQHIANNPYYTLGNRVFAFENQSNQGKMTINAEYSYVAGGSEKYLSKDFPIAVNTQGPTRVEYKRSDDGNTLIVEGKTDEYYSYNTDHITIADREISNAGLQVDSELIQGRPETS